MPSKFISGYWGNLNPNQSVAIAAGAQSSGVIVTGGLSLVGIIFPGVFTGTAVTFEVADHEDGFKAEGQIVFDTNASDTDTITINGTVITLVSGTPTGNQVQIAGTAALTTAAVLAFLQASTDAGLVACTYAAGTTTSILVTAVIRGSAGNAYTFTKTSSHITVTPAGGTLQGGGYRPLYDSSGQVSITIAQNRAYAVDPKNFQGVSFLKIKSGTAEGAARTLSVQLKGL